jgi:hypothetical protein
VQCRTLRGLGARETFDADNRSLNSLLPVLQSKSVAAKAAAGEARSKAKRRGKLQLPRTLSESHPGNDPGATAIDAGVSWISRTDVVEYIEGIHTELGCDVLMYRSVLRYGQVGIEE